MTNEAKFGEWVSVSDKMPDADGRYLVCCDYWSKWIGVDALRNGKWGDEKVSHYMPLPLPPKD